MVAPSHSKRIKGRSGKIRQATSQHSVGCSTQESNDCRQLRKLDDRHKETPPLLFYFGQFIDSFLNPDGPSMLKVATACMQDSTICALEPNTIDDIQEWTPDTSSPDWVPDIVMHVKGEDDVSIDLTFDGSYVLERRFRELLAIEQSGKRIYRSPHQTANASDCSRRYDSVQSDERSREQSQRRSRTTCPSVERDQPPTTILSMPLDSSAHQIATVPCEEKPQDSVLTAPKQKQAKSRGRSPVPNKVDSPSTRRGRSPNASTLRNEATSSQKKTASNSSASRGIWSVTRKRRSLSKGRSSHSRGRFLFPDRMSNHERAPIEANANTNTNEASSSSGAGSSGGAYSTTETGSYRTTSGCNNSASQSPRTTKKQASNLSEAVSDGVTSEIVKTTDGRPMIAPSSKITETSPLGLALLRSISSTDSEVDGSGSDLGLDCTTENTDQAQGSSRRRIYRIFSKNSTGTEKPISFFSKGKALLTRQGDERQPKEVNRTG